MNANKAAACENTRPAIGGKRRRRGEAESLLHNWKRQVSERSSDADKEMLSLKKRIRELEMERDILKKAARNLAAAARLLFGVRYSDFGSTFADQSRFKP
ncbi:MAG: hypothetical protein MSG64_17105 [Pyrinomonadaceae bacterium MAG19_C2-C3]|nr:hypothetical protein [Pyrinomonadaceae bacterium MAG19_C2-C3]